MFDSIAVAIVLIAISVVALIASIWANEFYNARDSRKHEEKRKDEY
jgi:hypothetical protein